MFVVCVKDEVPAALMDAHIKNVEASTTDGKYDPAAGLIQVATLSSQNVKQWVILYQMLNFLGIFAF